MGESGSGKSVSFLTVMGLINKKSAMVEGQVLFQGQDLVQMSNDELREIRGAKIAMIFQDPMTSLHPFYKVGRPDLRDDPGPRGHLQEGGVRPRPSRCCSG